MSEREGGLKRRICEVLVGSGLHNLHIDVSTLADDIIAALGRPAEISARDEEGGWHDTTPLDAEKPGDEEARLIAGGTEALPE